MFNREMQVWKRVAEPSSNPAKQPFTTTILQKSRELYQEYCKNIKWPTWSTSAGGQNSRKKTRTEELTDVAALIAQNKSFKKDLKKMKTGLHSRKALRVNGSTRDGGKYSWENHYGHNKNFSTKKDFLTWLHQNWITPPPQKRGTELNGGIALYVIIKATTSSRIVERPVQLPNQRQTTSQQSRILHAWKTYQPSHLQTIIPLAA